MNKILLSACIVLLTIAALNAQSIIDQGQVVRGKIMDRASNEILQTAAVELLNHSPRIAIQADSNGLFALQNIPLGHQRFRVVAEGYYELIVPQLIVAGKETVLNIRLDEEITVSKIVVVAKRNNKKKDIRRYTNIKMEAVDEFNAVSNYKLNVEEVSKYAGNWGDPARIVSNYPGLFTMDDTQNYIVSRGNSPYGIGWNIEGIPVDNPHHFATLGNTGAIFPLLNINMFDNSDFVNGAMPANFGNAYAGVFDINLRKGNNEKFEFLGQFSMYGAEVMAEGPIKKGGASFMLSYRYGIFSLLQLLGLEFSSSSSPNYQDINFKVDIPTKKWGDFALFGTGGLSHVNLIGADSDSSALFVSKDINREVNTNSGIIGITHQKYLKSNTYLKTTASFYGFQRISREDTVTTIGKEPYQILDENLQRFRLSTTLNTKISARTLVRLGGYGNIELIDIDNHFLVRDLQQEYFEGVLYTAGAFATIRHKFSAKFQAILGVHGRYWSLNDNSWSVEPRFSLNWHVSKRHQISFGYGWHSKTAPLPILFHVQQLPDGSYDNANQELGATRSHHAVLSYNIYLAKYWSMNVNIYTQLNTDIAVNKYSSSFSLINHGAFSSFPKVSNLETTGLSFNYGAELALEKYFNKGYYGLLGLTYGRSRYRASDLIWRSTIFDVQYILQMVVGKEFKIGKEKRNTFYADFRYSGHGGTPYIPIDLVASQAANREIRDTKNAYTQRLGSYNRIDVRLGFRFNNNKGTISHHLYVEALNATNFKNDLQVVYNPATRTITKGKQFGLIPILFYQIRF